MAKSLIRLEARKLRKKGVSVKKIAQYLKVPKSSASIWTRDIILTVEQLENLRKSSLEGAERGRVKNALLQKEKWRRLQFCNSDPKMIKFLLLWLERCFSISSLDIRCRVGINYIHIKRENIVKDYWSEITGIPLVQFTRTSFKKVENKKIYTTFNDHYGTLSVEVSHPSRFYGKIIGLIEGLHINMPT